MFILFIVLITLNVLTEYLFAKFLFSHRAIDRKYNFYNFLNAFLRIFWMFISTWFCFPFPIVLIGLLILLLVNKTSYKNSSFVLDNFILMVYLIFITLLMISISYLGFIEVDVVKLMDNAVTRSITLNIAFAVFNVICFLAIHFYPEPILKESNDRNKVVLYIRFLFICSVYQILDAFMITMNEVSQITYLLLISGELLIIILMFNLLQYNYVFARSEKEKRELEENEVLLAQQFFEKELLKRKSEYDSLTNAYNRREISVIMQEAVQANKKMVCVFIDLDGLKKINDRYGHSKGDQMLKKFATACMDTLNSKDKLARIGGDEFLLVFFDKSVAEIEQNINNLQLKLSESESKNNKIYFSYGISYNEDTVEDYISKADERMYLDKLRKKNGEVLC